MLQQSVEPATAKFTTYLITGLLCVTLKILFTELENKPFKIKILFKRRRIDNTYGRAINSITLELNDTVIVVNGLGVIARMTEHVC